MLKLEKSSPFAPLIYRLREREKWLGSQFLKAFMIAVLFHVGLFLLFHIHPFSLSSFFLFPPVEVQSDPFPSFTNIWGSAETIEEEDFFFPVISLIPDLAWEESTLHSDKPLNFHAFQHLEKQMWPMEHAPLSLPLEEPKIDLSIVGDLAEQALVQTDPRLLEKQPISFRAPLLVSYQVEMDERSGEIFWYERIQSSGQKEVDDLTEEILLNLKFSTDKGKMVGGRLHFQVFNEKE